MGNKNQIASADTYVHSINLKSSINLKNRIWIIAFVHLNLTFPNSKYSKTKEKSDMSCMYKESDNLLGNNLHDPIQTPQPVVISFKVVVFNLTLGQAREDMRGLWTEGEVQCPHP